MKRSYTYLPGLLFVLFLLPLGVQSQSCEYRLELFDSFGDGWDGASITVTINGVATSYTLETGSFIAYSIMVNNGDTVSLSYSPGQFDVEVRYAVYNPEGGLLFADGPFPAVGQLFSGPIFCPSCPLPQLSSISIDDVRAFTADISWKPSDPDGRYRVEFGAPDFAPGTGTIAEARGSQIRLTGLEEFTEYEFYLSVFCANGDTSRLAGPFAFKTLWAKDVGVVAITSPQTGCGLGVADSVKVTLRNFGGQPQSLIPFRYSVNGVDVPINIPLDGLFTGVLGKDSIFTIPFDATFNFSEPGEYTIAAWTELEEDSDIANDTTTLTIVSIPEVAEFPYFTDFETWNSGWTAAPDSRNPSWAFGRPAGQRINSAASGQNAWVTNLEGNYNNNELSYLLSPCFDFSSLTEDPRLAFAIQFDSESCCDKGWVEVSTDGGETWAKVGMAGTGSNWYNDPVDNWWEGDGGFDGWVLAYNTLTGSAGASDVRIRFVMSSDLTVGREGFAVDNIFISSPLARDLAMLNVNHTSKEECGEENDQVAITVTNLGTAAQSGFDVSYRINDGAVITENVGSLVVEPGASVPYTFTTPFNSSGFGSYEIVAWTSLAGEGFVTNDTAFFVFSTGLSTPFVEDFESRSLPQGWDGPSNIRVTDGHGNASYVLAFNLDGLNQEFSVTTPVIGPVQEGDSLDFDYRIVDFIGNGEVASTLGPDDALLVEISVDCGETYTTVFTLDRNNHVSSVDLRTLSISLEAFSGQSIKIRFTGIRGQGDYWMDIDNVNILQCPESLGLTTEVVDESFPGAKDGRATVVPEMGYEPFSYQWSNGDTTKTAVALNAGNYTVTVTDRFGCRDDLEIRINLGTATRDIEQLQRMLLFPNPASGKTFVQIDFRETVPFLQVQLVNLMGQVLQEIRDLDRRSAEYELDLNRYPEGLYFVRLIVDGRMKTQKLVKR